VKVNIALRVQVPDGVVNAGRFEEIKTGELEGGHASRLQVQRDLNKVGRQGHLIESLLVVGGATIQARRHTRKLPDGDVILEETAPGDATLGEERNGISSFTNLMGT
jgi:hypothetical protein